MCEDTFVERKTVMIGINNEMLQRLFVATQQPTSSIYIVIAITNDPTLSCHSIAATFDQKRLPRFFASHLSYDMT